MGTHRTGLPLPLRAAAEKGGILRAPEATAGNHIPCRGILRDGWTSGGNAGAGEVVGWK